jgi:calcineurin-like phosphoesterase family protein
MANWYMADPHFGHSKIIEYSKRPFNSVRHMDETILGNINAAVKPDDDLWIVGDFGFGGVGGSDTYLEDIHASINCRTHLVKGNHDEERVLALPWNSIHPLAEIMDGTRHVTLCHYQMVTWYRSRKGSIMLFGHVHEKHRGNLNCINVGVDVWGFRPIRLRDAMKRGNKLPINPLWSESEHGSSGPEIAD